MRRVVFALTALTVSCGFNPDLSRYEPCGEGGTCPAGFICLTEAPVCVPTGELTDAGAQDAGATDAGTSDAGTDAGLADAGDVDAGVDAGSDAGADAGTADAGDAGPQLALSNAPLPVATELSPYSFQFMPSGGVGGYHYTLDGGVPGFTLSASGQFFTTTTAPKAGTFSFALTVSDDDVPANRVTNGYSFTVRPLLRVASPTELNEGRVGRPYDEPLQATGGQPPYFWRVPDGGLPAWAVLDPDGGITGDPALGTANFTLEVTDSSLPTPQVATRRTQLVTKTLDTLLVNATPALPDGRVGTPYSYTLRSGALTTNHNWSVFSGALPSGVTLTNSPPIGIVAGTPTDAGTFNVTIRVSDGLTPVNRAYPVTIFPQ